MDEYFILYDTEKIYLYEARTEKTKKERNENKI